MASDGLAMVSTASEDATGFATLEFCQVGGEDEGLVCWGDAVMPEMVDTEGDDHLIGVGDFTVSIAVDFFDAFGEFSEASGDGFDWGDGFDHVVEFQSGFATDLGTVPSNVPGFFDFFTFGGDQVFGNFSDESECGIPEIAIAIGIDGGIAGLGLVIREIHNGLGLGHLGLGQILGLRHITISLQALPKL
jgi:hypothetical protein